jgi:hypothetical protein
MPTFQGCRQALGVPGVKGPTVVKGFGPPAEFIADQDFVITGVTKDATGAALGACTVELFSTDLDVREDKAVSDAAGVYRFYVCPTATKYLVAYKAGSPDVAGTSVNTLVGT